MKYMDSFKFLIVLLAVFVMAACGNGKVAETIEEEGDATDTTVEAPEEAAEDTEAVVEGTLTISAAASLVDVLDEITALFNEEYPDVEVDYNFGGSGALMQQILQGAPVDVFFSANADHFREVMEEGHIDEENAVDLLTNELVLIVPAGSDAVTSFDDLENADEIGIGNPESVPAGEYSVEAFESMNIMEDIESKFVYAEDVRQVLNYVETGNVDAGVVYHTDTLMSDDIDVIDAATEDAHSEIVYPLGMMNDTDNEAAQLAFFEFMQSEEAGEVFNEYGFIFQ